MAIENSENSNDELFSKPLKVEKENIICKDGFCSLPNQNDNHSLNKASANLFEPI